MLLVTSGMFARAQESQEGHQTQAAVQAAVQAAAQAEIQADLQAPAELEPQSATQTAHAPAAQAEPQQPANSIQSNDSILVSPAKQTTYTQKYTIYFRVNESTLDPNYLDNGQTIETMIREISSAISAKGRVSCDIEIVSSASPEGRYHHNEKLSERRMDVVLAALRKSIDVTDVTFHTNSLVEDWNIVADYVAEDQQVPCRQEVLQIINSFDGQQDIRAELQKIGGGAYDYILNNFFPLLRSTKVVAVYDLSERVAHPQLQSVSVTFTRNATAPQTQLTPAPKPAAQPTPQPAPQPAQEHRMGKGRVRAGGADPLHDGQELSDGSLGSVWQCIR